MFEYKFVTVPIKPFSSTQNSRQKEFSKLEETVNEYARAGWRLNQVFFPTNGTTPLTEGYVLIFEKELA